jgi:hypothetical protein
MSGKTGVKATGNKPSSTRRHDSLADGAFGHDDPQQIRSESEQNRKISGQPSKQHSKNATKKGQMTTKGQATGQSERDPKGKKGQYTGAGDSALTKK